MFALGALMVASNSQSNIPDVAQRGERIYRERLKDILEPNHNGKYVVIDVETGEYEVDSDHLAASDRAASKRSGAKLYGTRVGYGAAGRIGGRGRVTRP